MVSTSVVLSLAYTVVLYYCMFHITIIILFFFFFACGYRAYLDFGGEGNTSWERSRRMLLLFWRFVCLFVNAARAIPWLRGTIDIASLWCVIIVDLGRHNRFAIVVREVQGQLVAIFHWYLLRYHGQDNGHRHLQWWRGRKGRRFPPIRIALTHLPPRIFRMAKVPSAALKGCLDIIPFRRERGYGRVGGGWALGTTSETMVLIVVIIGLVVLPFLLA
mmetsp:Transcript_7224/g.12755  ORF Transcript_7224/g.12755 Transcript_7224/m.12755 type:complete len:218 (-) Transcript_7224:618-1271(-)